MLNDPNLNKLNNIKKICNVCKYRYSILDEKCPKCGTSKSKSITYLLESLDNNGDVIREENYRIIWREVRALVTKDASISNYRDAIIEAHNMVEKAVMAFYDNKNDFNKMNFMGNVVALREKGIYLDTKGLSVAKQIRNDCVHKNRLVLKEKLNYKQVNLAIDEYGRALTELGVLPKEEYYLNREVDKEISGNNTDKTSSVSNKKINVAMFLLGTGCSGLFFLMLTLILKWV